MSSWEENQEIYGLISFYFKGVLLTLCNPESIKLCALRKHLCLSPILKFVKNRIMGLKKCVDMLPRANVNSKNYSVGAYVHKMNVTTHH